MSQVYSPTATYGSNAVKNRVKIGGALGSNQYFYKTNAKTGTVEINRYEVNNKTGKITETSIGNIPQGGKFTPNSNASSAEKTHYNSPRSVGKVRAQALQIARREWDGKTQPPPTQAIYGTNSGDNRTGFTGFTPPGSSTPNTSTKGTETTGFSNIAQSALDTALTGGSIGDIADSALKQLTGQSQSGKVMIYPTTLRAAENAQDYIKIRALEYAPKQRAGGDNLGGWKERTKSKNRTGKGTVILPIPGGISDSNSVSWGDDKMGPVETAMANLALTGIEGGGGAMADEAARLANTIKNNSEKVKKSLKAGIAGMASGTGAQLLTRTTGQILNPNMELLFKDPSLRPFTFTWKLAARNRQEANEIIKIINFFKRGMAPQTAGANLFLKSPWTWELTYMHKGREHKYLNKFKECAMNSITTQYTPDGNYATFETGHMTAYSITTSFTELEPVFSSDYSSKDEIGY